MSLKAKRNLSYVISLLINGILVTSLGAALKELWNSFRPDGINLFQAALIILACYGLVTATLVYAKIIRTTKRPIPLISVELPNFLYDEKFVEEGNFLDNDILHENTSLNEYIVELESLLDGYIDELNNKDRDLEFEAHISDIYIRHHKNSSRLVRSLLQLINENRPNWKWEFCNNVLDECGTVLLKDSADKSSSIYFINEHNKLEMFAYNRIEFSSSRKRKFRQNEGFAGHVWSYGNTTLINDISKSKLFQGEFSPVHEYGSILGIPIKIGDEIVGVLNVQSEGVEGFTHEDERSVKFYADMCALAHYYDTIITKREGGV